MKKGLGRQVLVALLSTLFGHIPGVIYGLYVVTNEQPLPVACGAPLK